MKFQVNDIIALTGLSGIRYFGKVASLAPFKVSIRYEQDELGAITTWESKTPYDVDPTMAKLLSREQDDPAKMVDFLLTLSLRDTGPNQRGTLWKSWSQRATTAQS